MRARLLGRTVVTVSGSVVDLSPKLALVAAYLCLHRNEWVRRDSLKEIFWGGSDEHHAAGSLRTALHTLRCVLLDGGMPEDAFLLRRDAVRLTVETDVAEFDEGCGKAFRQPGPREFGQMISAASLYAGPFLADADLDLLLDYDWVLAERARLDDLHQQLMSELVERLEAAGLRCLTLEYAQRWRDHDPLNEAASRALMRAYIDMGRPAAAARELTRCRESLLLELGVELSAETTAVAERLGVAQGMIQDDVPAPPSPRRLRALRNPLENAALLLARGEAEAVAGDLDEAARAISEAQRIIERHGSGEDIARAAILAGRVLLMGPPDVRLREALPPIGEAIAYYDVHGSPAALTDALLVGCSVARECGECDRSVAWGEEAVARARSEGNRDAETRAWAELAITLARGLRFQEAASAWEPVMARLSAFRRPDDIVRIMTERAGFAILVGELPAAELTLREALAALALLPRTPNSLRIESAARFLLMMVVQARGGFTELADLALAPDARPYALPGQHAFEEILLMQGEAAGALQAAATTLRGLAGNLPPDWFACYLRLLVEVLLEHGMTAEARPWSAVLVRLSRRPGWKASLACALAVRGVVMFESGEPERARRYLAAAREAGVGQEMCRWTGPWTGLLEGLLADAGPTPADALLAAAAKAFSAIGSERNAAFVRAHMSAVAEAG